MRVHSKQTANTVLITGVAPGVTPRGGTTVKPSYSVMYITCVMPLQNWTS